jgi:diguanylate cyclase (GGDEF)-like protein
MADTRLENNDILVEAGYKINESLGSTPDGRVILNSKGSKLGERIIDDYIIAAKDHDLAQRDPLTGLHNRRYLDDILNANVDSQGAIAMVDIDHFKEVNDTYGHKTGDEVLKQVTSLISKNVRPGDVVARFGGEEFVIFFPRMTKNKDLEARMEKIRNEIEQQDYRKINGPEKCTVSVGATIRRPDEDWQTTILRADDTMYNAKESGRNQVHVA